MILSKLLDLKEELNKLGVFDPLLDRDNPFYINIIRLRETKVEEFIDSHESINNHFSNIIKLITSSAKDNQTIFNKVVEMCEFNEVDEIVLGTSVTGSGRGIGKITARKIAISSYDIIKSGIRDPEIFHLVGLFTYGVGVDLLSDMISRIIIDDIKQYTLNIMNELNINKDTYPNLEFENGFLINPFESRKLKVYLVPKSLLHNIPISRGWSDIGLIISENEYIRRHINETIARAWSTHTTKTKKEEIMKTFKMFGNPIIKKYKETTIEQYDLKENLDYYVNVFLNENDIRVYIDEDIKNSKSFSLITLNKFKDFFENKEGNLLKEHNDIKKLSEDLIQLMFSTFISSTKEVYGYDVNREPKTGRGNIDFKISKGEYDKTIIEFKLSTNSNLLHGITTQLEEYTKSESTENKIFVIFDFRNNADMIKDIKKTISKETRTEVVIIDMIKKETASLYQGGD